MRTKWRITRNSSGSVPAFCALDIGFGRIVEAVNRGDAAGPAIEPLREAQDQFVLEWGRMSSSWGINRTMAQIHALLLVTGRAHSMDDIIDRLGISRGNASMSLRDLMDWGVVQRFRKQGDRKDLYRCDPDPWHMVAWVVRERKRRELDPTAAAIRECVARVPEDDEGDEAQAFRKRLGGLLEIFQMIDKVYEQVFRTDETLIETVALLREGLNLREVKGN
jgi:HTH-type transcriptional regulator, glycine betaine synthesis regulator